MSNNSATHTNKDISIARYLSPWRYFKNDRTHSCGLIRGGLFTNWKFGFVFDSRLHDLQLLVVELYSSSPGVLYGELRGSLLNKISPCLY